VPDYFIKEIEHQNKGASNQSLSQLIDQFKTACQKPNVVLTDINEILRDLNPKLKE